MNKLALSLLLLTITLPAWAAPPEILNGGDNGGITYVDGVNQAGDTVVEYQDTAPTPNTAYAVSNRVSVGVTLFLEKEIRDLSGTLIPENASLYKGQEFYYVIYIWNRMTDQTVTDVRMSDALPAGVTFTGPIDMFVGTLTGGTPPGNPGGRLQSVPYVPSPNWTLNTSWMGLAWSAAAGRAGISGSTIGVGRTTYTQINLNAGQVLAARFKVRIN